MNDIKMKLLDGDECDDVSEVEISAIFPRTLVRPDIDDSDVDMETPYITVSVYQANNIWHADIIDILKNAIKTRAEAEIIAEKLEQFAAEIRETSEVK